MPKLKTNSGAKKRFRKSASGNYKRAQSHRRHILTKKSPKRKRQLRAGLMVHEADVAAVDKLLRQK